MTIQEELDDIHTQMDQKDSQIATLTTQFNDCNNGAVALGQQITQLTQQIADAAMNSSQSPELQACQQMIVALQNQISQGANTANNQNQDLINSLQQQLSQVQQTITDKDNNIAMINQQLASYQSANYVTPDVANDLRNQISALQQQLQQANGSQALQDAQNNFNAQLAALQAKIDAARSALN